MSNLFTVLCIFDKLYAIQLAFDYIEVNIIQYKFSLLIIYLENSFHTVFFS